LSQVITLPCSQPCHFSHACFSVGKCIIILRPIIVDLKKRQEQFVGHLLQKRKQEGIVPQEKYVGHETEEDKKIDTGQLDQMDGEQDCK
jgi:hypothetical protein